MSLIYHSRDEPRIQDMHLLTSEPPMKFKLTEVREISYDLKIDMYRIEVANGTVQNQ